MASDATEPAANDEVDAPLVFQCGNCKAILGDTFAFVCSDPTLNTITLQGTSDNVTQDSVLDTSQSEYDLGSTFVKLNCVCGKHVGRIYKTTSRVLDHIRDYATLDIGAITSYKLGTGVQNSDLMQQLMEIPTARKLHEDVIKLKKMILLHQERIGALETNSNNGEEGQSNNPKRQRK